MLSSCAAISASVEAFFSSGGALSPCSQAATLVPDYGDEAATAQNTQSDLKGEKVGRCLGWPGWKFILYNISIKHLLFVCNRAEQGDHIPLSPRIRGALAIQPSGGLQTSVLPVQHDHVLAQTFPQNYPCLSIGGRA